MANPIRRPILCAFLYPPTCLRLSRKFSQSPAAARSGMRPPALPKAPPQKSIKVLMREAERTRPPPSDMGLLDDTFIMPTGSNKPSIFRLPRERLRLEWHRFSRRARDLATVLYFKFLSTKKPNPRPMLRLRSTNPTAVALHNHMYTAFAEGDTTTLSSICAEGLFTSFRARLASRPQNERLRWTLHRHTRRPRVVSHRVGILPQDQTALRQAVVRIRSRQSLAKIKPDGEVVEGTGQEKEVTEYVVVQKTMWRGKEEEWKVWGTVEESDWEKVLAGEG